MGQRTAKHVYTRNDELLSSTYYILDAQGNVMTTYNLNIDTANTSLVYFQAEKYIYGSARLGMLKDSVNVLGSAYGNTDSSNVVHTLGNKRYELSNHLGNVLAVLTDKPIPHNNGGTVDYWEANISSAYDYSPFGVMLTGRTFEGKQTVCHDSTVQAILNALEEGFGSWGSWTADANGAITYVADEMQISNPSSSKKNIGTHKDFNTGTGLHSVSFKVMGNVCANVVYWPPSSTPIPIKVSVKDNLGNTVTTGNYPTAGTYSLSFTPASTGLTYRIEFYMANANAFCFFRVDDVLVSYNDATTLTVCKEVEDGYRYGFNTQEKTDEIAGKGNHYTAQYWEYSPRLGKRWNIDPVIYPWQSPYVVNNNNPLYFYDVLGLWGKKKSADKKQEKTVEKLGSDRVGDVFNKNEGTDKKADWGFHVYGEGKDKHTRTEKNSEGEITANAYRPDASVFNDGDFKEAKSTFGLYTPMAISINVSFIFGGGASYTLGWAQDKFGRGTGFQTVGGGIGLELGIGIHAGVIEETGDDKFNVDQLKGKGFQYSGGVGPLSISKSGDIEKKAQFQKNGQNYNIVDGGFSNDLRMLKLLKLGKVKIGGSYQWNKTYLFGTDKKK